MNDNKEDVPGKDGTPFTIRIEDMQPMPNREAEAIGAEMASMMEEWDRHNLPPKPTEEDIRKRHVAMENIHSMFKSRIDHLPASGYSMHIDSDSLREMFTNPGTFTTEELRPYPRYWPYEKPVNPLAYPEGPIGISKPSRTAPLAQWPTDPAEQEKFWFERAKRSSLQFKPDPNQGIMAKLDAIDKNIITLQKLTMDTLEEVYNLLGISKDRLGKVKTSELKPDHLY